MSGDDGFGLDDERYWVDPWQTRRALARPLMRRGESRLIIGAPRVMPLAGRERLPLAILRTCRPDVARRVPLKAAAVVTAFDLRADELRAALALPTATVARTRHRTVSRPQASLLGDANAMVAQGITVDLMRRLAIPALRGTHLLSVLVQDQRSNRIAVKVIETTGYDDPEVDRFLHGRFERRLPAPRLRPDPEESSVSYEREEYSPRIPRADGVSMRLLRTTVPGYTPRWLVFASYRLPVKPHQVLEPPASRSARGRAIRSGAAAVPISLLLTGAVDAQPMTVALCVRSQALERAEGGQMWAVGHFRVDLFRHIAPPTVSQTFFAYAFAAGTLCGPFRADYNAPAAASERAARRAGNLTLIEGGHGRSASP